MSDATPDKDHHHSDDPYHRPPGHERKIDRDINLRAIAITVGGLALGTVLAFILMWWMHEALLSTEEARDPAPPALEEARETVMPPLPRLQASPEREMAQFLAQENVELSTYGWKDEGAGTVRIPVDRAMDVLVEQGRSALSMAPDPTAGDGNQLTSPAAEGMTGGAASAAASGTGAGGAAPTTPDPSAAAASAATAEPASAGTGDSGTDGREQ